MKAFLCAAAILSSVSFADADTVPSELIGSWGDSPAQCRSFHRKFQDVAKFGANEVSWCGGSSCQADVLSSKATATGYTLKTRAKLSGFTRDVVVTRVQEGVFESDGEAMVKCGESDKIAGIGRPGDRWDEQKATSAAFSALYAIQTRASCPGLQVDVKKATSIAAIGMTDYFNFLATRDFEIPASMTPDSQLTKIKRDAAYAVELDATEIAGYCQHVIDVFGPDGNLLPGLIADKGKAL